MHDWKLTAAILAVLAVPFGLAVMQDADKEHDPGDALVALAREELGEVAQDEVPEIAPAPARPAIDERLTRLSGDIDGDIERGLVCESEVGDLAAAAEALTSAWGAPFTSPAGARTWLAPEVGRRVVLDRGSEPLRCEPYMPLTEVLGQRDGRFGFARIELLGASVEDVLAAYGDDVANQDDGSVLIFLPPVDLAGGFTSLSLDLERGRVTGYSLTLEERRADLALQLLESHAGPARRDGDRFVFGERGDLSLTVDPTGLLTLSGR